MRRVATFTVVALLALTSMASLLPASALSSIRDDWRWLGRILNWIEAIPAPLDMNHALLFGILGLAALASSPRAGLRDVGKWFLVLGAFSAFTESMQVLVPGRRGNWRDVRDDLIGASIGLLVAWALRTLFGRIITRRASVVAKVATIDPRTWITAQLRGLESSSGPNGTAERATWIDEIERSGMAPLLHQHWSRRPGREIVAQWLRDAVAELDRKVRMQQLLLLSEARRIEAALTKAGIEHLWLKGIALAHWLYPEPQLRPTQDLDLLFASHSDAMAAADALAGLGYRLPRRHIAGDLYVYEILAVRADLGLELDLHWRLANTALFAERLQWPELRAAANPVPQLGSGALALAPAHALLHAAMHRAQNYLNGRADRLIWLYDLHLLANQLSAPEWTLLIELAIERRLAEPCLDALRASEREFGTALPEDGMQRLQAAANREWLRSARLSDWTYFQRAVWRELPDLGSRLRWLRQMLIGDLAHLRERYGHDGETRAGCLIARRLQDGLRRWRSYQSRSEH